MPGVASRELWLVIGTTRGLPLESEKGVTATRSGTGFEAPMICLVTNPSGVPAAEGVLGALAASPLSLSATDMLAVGRGASFAPGSGGLRASLSVPVRCDT